MKKMKNSTRTEINKRGLARWAFAIVCLAFLFVGNSALAAPPANDNFANATVIPASPPATVTGNNIDATFESGEPDHSPSEAAGGKSAWWSWTPSATGAVTIDTGGSESIVDTDGLDTQLAVYTGNSVDSLSLVVNNEDSTKFTGGRSEVSFNAVSGTVYHIAVDGWNGDMGNINLNFLSGGTTNPPPTGLALTVNVTGSGTVTKDPSKTSYDTNDVVTLTANPTGTNTFLNWGGDIGTNSPTDNPITIVMDASKTVTAAFTTSGGGGGGGGEGFTTITVLVNGEGRVTPNLNNKNRLKIGKRYRLTAHPKKDWVFAGWDGAPSGADIDGQKLSFLMEPGLTITANFAPNPFLDAGVVGTFNGLLFDIGSTNGVGVSQDCSGEFTIKVNKNGHFSGRITKGGKRLTTSGTILPDGTVTGAKVGRRGQDGTLDLQLDMTNHTDKITGTLTTSNCVANLEGDRAAFSSKNPAPLQGNYTIVFPGDTNSVNGNGFATVSVSKSGRVTTRGELADGTKISDRTTLSQNGQAPVYIPLYHKNGSLVGWLTLTETDASGLFSWIKPAGEKVIPGGLETDIEIIGSPFDKKSKPSLTLSNGVVEIGGNGLTESLLIPVELSGKNNISPTGANEQNLKLKLLSSGLLRGSFIDPSTQKNTKLKGIVLQNDNVAEGYFISSDVPGFFEVRGDTTVIDTNEPPVTTNEPPIIEPPVTE